jgi:hypothetical protein
MFALRNDWIAYEMVFSVDWIVARVSAARKRYLVLLCEARAS